MSSWAAALLHDPGIIYLDEPTIGLDVVAKERIREFILALVKEKGTTVILTTHDIGDIERLCRRVIIIDKGRLIYDGALSEIKQSYCHLRQVVFSLAPGCPEEEFGTSLKSLDPSIDVKKKDSKVVIGFDPRRISASEVTRHAVNAFPILDLTVEEADLEAIIREIYQQGMRQ
jgi:ABC-2 type transport system ATP-binding protein